MGDRHRGQGREGTADADTDEDSVLIHLLHGVSFAQGYMKSVDLSCSRVRCQDADPSCGLPRSLAPMKTVPETLPETVQRTPFVSACLDNVLESTDSFRFEIRGFAKSSDPFSSKMNARISSFFQMRPNASGATRM